MKYVLFTRRGYGKWADYALESDYPTKEAAVAVASVYSSANPQVVSWSLWDPLELEDLLDDAQGARALYRALDISEGTDVVERLRDRGWLEDE